MGDTTQSDPFTEGQSSQQHAPPPQVHPQPSQVPNFDINNRAYAPDYSFQNAYNSSYPAASYGTGMPYPAYGGPYQTYNAPYSGNYATGYNSYAPNFGYSRQSYATAGQFANNARETSAMVLSGMHDAMSRFARVSAMIEDVLRNLHMLFDAIFGLGYSLGAFRQEARLWLAIKTGPVGYVARLLRRAGNVWRLLCVFFMSPLAGRFSPVALVLRILGLVPDEDVLEHSLLEMWRQHEGDGGERDDNGTGLPGDSSSL